MRRFCYFGLMALACLSRQDLGGQTVVVEHDGSVQVQFRRGESSEQKLVFHFGLPKVALERRWEENGVLRASWVSNGVRYLQTVLITERPSGSSSAGSEPGTVLLVNIEGENTNTVYAEASAELAVEIDGKRQALELQHGVVWRREAESRALVGALEIPESGIKAASGDALKFYGNIPPSLKGSLTLKIPLERLLETKTPDWLVDLEFEAALRRTLRPRDGPITKQTRVRLVVAEPK